jgi:hypothetical protein
MGGWTARSAGHRLRCLRNPFRQRLFWPPPVPPVFHMYQGDVTPRPRYAAWVEHSAERGTETNPAAQAQV